MLTMHSQFEPVQFLAIGHITEDITPDGRVLGGGVTYGGLTAQALGLSVGIVSSHARGIDLQPLQNLQCHVKIAPESTTFTNQEMPDGRIQRLSARADRLLQNDIPTEWILSDIVHISPVADEVEHDVVDLFKESLLCLAPQGWLRSWDETGLIKQKAWQSLELVLPKADLVFFSMEDLNHDFHALAEIEKLCNTLIVTDGYRSIRMFQGGRRLEVAVQAAKAVNPTGAGDIFAASFIAHYYHSHDILAAAKYASLIAMDSVTRPGLSGVPTSEQAQVVEMKL